MTKTAPPDQTLKTPTGDPSPAGRPVADGDNRGTRPTDPPPMDSRPTDTRERILATGRRLTAQQGYTGTGLGELLKAAGVPKGSFYHYFASKEAFGCALLDSFIRDYDQRLARTLYHPGLDGRARIIAYFTDWHRHQISPDPQDHCLVTRLSAEVADLSPDMSRILSDGVTRIVAHLARVLRDGEGDGSVGAVADVQALAQAIYHQWLGASLVASLFHDDAPLHAAMAMTQQMLPAPAR